MAGQAEIAQFHMSARSEGRGARESGRGQKDILRLNVSMDDAAPVRSVKGAGHVGHHRGRLGFRQPFTPGEHFTQTFPSTNSMTRYGVPSSSLISIRLAT